jgi:hypothetical protein
LFHHDGDVEPITTSDILGRVQETLRAYQRGPLANYMPYTPQTGRILQSLANLKPTLLATMHGSSFSGNAEQALRDLAVVMREVLGEESSATAA